MKILVLVEDLRINTTSAGICNSNIINSLLLGGHELTCLYDYSTSDTFPWLESSYAKFENIKSVKQNILIKAISKLPKSNAMSYHLTGFGLKENNKIHAWKKTIKEKLSKEISYDFIMVLGAGSSMLNYFAISNIKTSVPYIVNYHDPYPYCQYPKPYFEYSKIVGKLQAKKSNIVMQNAFKVSFPSQRLYEWMLQFHPVLEGKSIVIPHSDSKLKSLPGSEMDDLVNLNSDKFNLLHIGSLLGPRNPKYLISAFSKFCNEDQNRKENSVLNIIGRITDDKFTLNKFDTTGIQIINKRISYKKSLALMQQASVLVLLEAVAENSPFMPGKLANYFMAKKPILALTPKSSETTRLLGDQYPYMTETDNESEIYTKIVSLWNEWNSTKFKDYSLTNLEKYVSPKHINEIIEAQFNK